MNLELKHVLPYVPYKIKCQYVGIVDVQKYKNATFNDPFDNEDTGYGLKVAEIKEIKLYKNYWKAYIGKYHGHLKSFIDGYDFQLILHPMSDLTKPCLEGGKIPIVELALNFRMQMYQFTNDKFFDNNYGRFIKTEELSYNIIEKLCEWHFNVFNLPKDLWIDINTIKK